MIRRLALLLLALAFVRHADADWAATGQSEIPLEGTGSTWMVHATLNGTVSGLFLLDTGASFCVLAPSTARRLSLSGSGQSIDLRTANGTVSAPLVKLRTVDVGGNRARDVQAVVHPALGPPYDGVIGLSFLNNFQYGIDPRRHILRLR